MKGTYGRKLMVWLLVVMLLLPAAGLAQQTAVYIDGVRTAFFDAAGNFLPPLDKDGVAYVPLASFCESLGMVGEAKGQAVTVDGISIGMFDENGQYMAPVEENGIAYVPLKPFCQAVGVKMEEEDGAVQITRPNTQPQQAPAQESKGRVALHTGNFGQYFSYGIDIQNFSMYQQKYNLNGSLLYSNSSETDYVLRCDARSSFEIENVNFTVSGKLFEYHADVTGLGGASFSVSMPASGSLSRTKHETGTAVQQYATTKSISFESVKLTSVSGCVIVQAGEADAANAVTMATAQKYLANGNTADAKSLLKALASVDYADAQAQYDAAVAQENDAREEAYKQAQALEQSGDYDRAIAAYEELGYYKDSVARRTACRDAKQKRDYQAAVALKDAGQYEEAIAAFETMGDYADCAAQIEVCRASAMDRDYAAACEMMNEKQYEEAITAFEKLISYEDSEVNLNECKYQYARVLLAQGETEKAYGLLAALPKRQEIYALMNEDAGLNQLARQAVEQRYEVGTSFELGMYYHKLLNWRVLDRKGVQALVVCEESPTMMAYHEYSVSDSPKVVNWEMCTLRTALNSQFMQDAFDETERSYIRAHLLENKDSQMTVDGKVYKTDGGGNTVDYIFILTDEEWKSYGEWRPDFGSGMWNRNMRVSKQQKSGKKKYYEHYPSLTLRESNTTVPWVPAKSLNNIIPAVWIDVYALEGLDAPVDMRYVTLKSGDESADVLTACEKLCELGYIMQKAVQTKYNKNIVSAVKKFEKAEGLTVDGELSPQDQAVLFGK